MNLQLNPRRAEKSGSILAYFVLAVAIMSAVVTVASYSVHATNMTRRRSDMVSALHFSESGMALGCEHVNAAFLGSTGTFQTRLTGSTTAPYTYNNNLSSASQLVYDRTVTSPFTNQSVLVRLFMTNSAAPTTVRVATSATVSGVVQSNNAYLEMAFGFGAAILSDAIGTSSTGTAKGDGQAGNVAIPTPGAGGTTFIDGGIRANGRVNTGTIKFDSTLLSMTNYGTANQIPDYTADGSVDQLFDFGRFKAVAKASGNYFTNVAAFVAAGKTNTLEGVIYVEVSKTEMSTDMSATIMPSGINIRGTLVVGFATNVVATDKWQNTAALNINAANLSGLNPTNPATFTTGYPPTYTNPAKNPANVDITSYGYANFTASDDLPAVMYNVGIFDVHGPVNVCGVVYSPSFFEIENKIAGQLQYFKGSMISGGGVYIQNDKVGANRSIVSYDPNALDKLATSGTKGKVLTVSYIE